MAYEDESQAGRIWSAASCRRSLGGHNRFARRSSRGSTKPAPPAPSPEVGGCVQPGATRCVPSTRTYSGSSGSSGTTWSTAANVSPSSCHSRPPRCGCPTRIGSAAGRRPISSSATCLPGRSGTRRRRRRPGRRRRAPRRGRPSRTRPSGAAHHRWSAYQPVRQASPEVRSPQCDVGRGDVSADRGRCTTRSVPTAGVCAQAAAGGQPSASHRGLTFQINTSRQRSHPAPRPLQRDG